MPTISGLIVSLLALVGPAAAGPNDVYHYVGDDGVPNYSDRKPRTGSYEIIYFKCRACGWKEQVRWESVRLNLNDYRREVWAASRKYAVDEALVRAVIHVESWFQHDAVSDMGAQGLMQLMPATQRYLGVSRPFDPGQNIEGGVKHLRRLLDRFNNDIDKASAAYNAGETAVLRHAGIPPYAETRNFVRRVQILRRRYASAL